MSQFVTTGATCLCSFGTTPGTFNATNTPMVLIGGKPAGVLTDIAPMVNITSFGMCSSMANPQVAAATAAAMGVLTPQPCVPSTTGSWIPSGSAVLFGGKPCLTMDCSCMCMWGGKVTLTNPGQVTAMTG